MNEVLDLWMKNVKTYPPSEIFYQKYGKEAKAEERLKETCESVYRFCFPDNAKNNLGDLGASYRELEVTYLMGFDKIKPEYIKKVADKFLEDVKSTITALDELFKKDQLLQQYYTPWKLKYSEINSIVYDLTKGYV